MRTIALIPAFRPDGRMATLVRELAASGIAVVVVDDGSGEGWKAAFQTASRDATVLTHAQNLGKGTALKTGLAHIERAFAAPYVVVSADADGQHRTGDIMRVAAAAATHPGELVLGSRGFTGEVPMRSRLGNAVMRHMFRLATGSRVHDTQTGLRAFTNEAVSWMRTVEGTRYEYETNVLLRWTDEGRPVRELTIETVYLDGNRASHFNAVRDSARICREMARFSLPTLARFTGSSLACFALDYALFCLASAALGTLALPAMLACANVGARIVSASVNYRLNRDAVFGERGRHAAARYAALAVTLLMCNTALLGALTMVGVSPYVAKVLVEATLFVASYVVQRTLVFGGARRMASAATRANKTIAHADVTRRTLARTPLVGRM